MGEPTVTVTPWNSRPSQERPNAPFHDCLWEIALEQAVLDRMKRTGEDFNTSKEKVTPQEHMKQLDTVCDDNGFRRLGDRAGGRDPNLIFDGEKIKVRLDPSALAEAAPGVNNEPVGNAYNKAVQSDTGQGPDLKKKEQVDQWLKTIPDFEKLPEKQRVAWLEAYTREGVDTAKLSKLASLDAFKTLDEDTKERLIKLYGRSDQSLGTSEIDKLLTPPSDGGRSRLALIGTEGFVTLDNGQQKRLLERYDQDRHFHAALDKIVMQKNFNDQNPTAEAHALDILYRYAGRKEGGYGKRPEDVRTLVLTKLYDDVLSQPGFKLDSNGGIGKPESAEQSKQIDDFAEKVAPDLKNK